MKLQIFGSVDCRFDLLFRIRDFSGETLPANLYCVDTLAEVYEILEKFYAARKKVICKCSNSILGGGYPMHSIEWLACHSCEVEFFDALKNKKRVKYFKQPYLEQIDKRFDDC